MDPVLVLADDSVHVQPGAEARLAAKVRNAGGLVEQYRLEILGDAARWSQVVPRQISVLPGEAQQATVQLVFGPPPPPLTVAGEVAFGLRCVSMEDPDRCAVVEGTLVVGAVVGLQTRLDPVSPAGRWTGRYRAVFDNTGTVPARLRLDASDERRMLRFALAPAELTVEPGRSGTAYLAVQPRQPMLRGRAVAHPFAVGYRSDTGDRGAQLNGTFEQRPVIGRAVLVAATLLLVVATVGGALLLRRGAPTPDPVALAGPPPPVALVAAVRLGPTSVQVRWQRSPYATGYVVQHLLADGSVAGSKEVGDRDQSALAWDGLAPGRHCFQVVATGTAARSAPSKPLCATLTRPAAKASATPAVTPGGSGAPPAGPAPGGQSAPPEPPGAPAADPVQGAYVVYGPPTAIDDAATQGVAERLVARLQAADVDARLVDSRTSARVLDGANDKGVWVVLKDGFADFAAARAECNARRAIAPECYAFPPA